LVTVARNRQEGKKETRKITGKGQGGKEKRRSRQKRKKKRGGTMKGRNKSKGTREWWQEMTDRRTIYTVESREQKGATRKENTRMKN
jgi:hypothetical protein